MADIFLLDKYIVKDTRDSTSFKKSSFSGYKRGEIFSEFQKSCSEHKLENALFWMAEIHCSWAVEELFEKIFSYISSKIHLNSYHLPIIIWNHYLYWKSITDINNNNINEQRLRNSLFEIAALLVQCETSRVLQKKKAIKDTDFNIQKLSKMITCSTNHISPNIIKQKDPKVLTIVINELSYCLMKHADLQGNIQDKKDNNREFYMEKAVYWISWLHKWETVQKKKGGSPDCAYREVTDISKEESCDIVWIIWSVILAECRRRVNDLCITQVAALFNMYKYNFARTKKTGKMPIIIHTLALIILDNAPVSKTELTNPYTIQAVMKCNDIYSLKKQHECAVKLPAPDLFTVKQVPGTTKEPKTKKGKKDVSIKTIESIKKFDLMMNIDRERQSNI